MQIFHKYLQQSGQHTFLIFISILLIIMYLQQMYIVIPQISNMPVVDKVVKVKIVESYYKYRWLMFLVPVIILLIRVSLVAMCLFLGSFFIERWSQMKYVDGWNVALKSDAILILFSVAICAVAVISGPDSAAGLWISLALIGGHYAKCIG